VRVGSSRRPWAQLRSEKVLNGQAIKAIRLRSLLVVSEFTGGGAGTVNFYLAMDPSQSFDNIESRMLLAELAKVSSMPPL